MSQSQRIHNQNQQKNKQAAIWTSLVLIVAAIAFFSMTHNFLWIPLCIVIGIVLLTRMDGFLWKKHLCPIVAAVLLLGSWIAENTAEDNWIAEKDELMRWIQIQE